MRAALIVGGCLLLTLIVAGGAVYGASEAFDSTKTDRYSYSENVDRVVVKAESGDIEVSRGAGAVEVAEKRHYVIDGPDVDRSIEDGVLTIEAECGDVVEAFCSTDFEIEVPQGVDVDARTYVGDVEVDGVRAERVKARSYVGNVDVNLPRGSYDVETDAAVGDADVDGLRTSERSKYKVEAEVYVGSVDVRAR